MRRFATTKVRLTIVTLAIATLGMAGLALIGLFTPVRAMVDRAPSSAAQRPATISQDRTSPAPSSGVISIRVVADPRGPFPPPARFYGAVALRGKAATSGTTVTAHARNGATCGSAAVTASGAGSRYALDITSDDPACTASGAPLSFRIGGAGATSAGTAAIPEISGAVRADLNSP